MIRRVIFPLICSSRTQPQRQWRRPLSAKKLKLLAALAIVAAIAGFTQANPSWAWFSSWSTADGSVPAADLILGSPCVTSWTNGLATADLPAGVDGLWTLTTGDSGSQQLSLTWTMANASDCAAFFKVRPVVRFTGADGSEWPDAVTWTIAAPADGSAGWRLSGTGGTAVDPAADPGWFYYTVLITAAGTTPDVMQPEAIGSGSATIEIHYLLPAAEGNATFELEAVAIDAGMTDLQLAYILLQRITGDGNVNQLPP